MEIKRGNPKAFETVALALDKLRGLEGRVGWFETSKYDNGTPVAYVAAIQELGYGPIPPRATMRPTAVDKKQEWADIAAQGSRAVIAGTVAPDQVMEQLTGKAESDIFKAISTLTEPTLSPITLELRAMKKADPNLIVTGATVGIAAARVKAPGYVLAGGVSTKPLDDSGKMLATLTHVVTKV